MPAMLATVGWTILEPVEFLRLLALRALSQLPVPDFHQVTETSVIVRECLEKLTDC